MMQFHFFDKNDTLIFSRSDAVNAFHIVHEMAHSATFPDVPQKVISAGIRVGWIDETGNFQMFEIRQPSRSIVSGMTSYRAEHIIISELSDYVIEDKRPRDTTPSNALSVVLSSTPWQVGLVDASNISSTNFYYESVWECIVKIRDAWGVALVPRIMFSGKQITGKYIDILSSNGADRGVRLSLNSNIQEAGISYDDRELCTAYYGRGKGEVVGETETGAPTYGRRINFSDIVWSKAAGDPADKPAGQEWVEDVLATNAFTRNGDKRTKVIIFPDIEDPAELLAQTWSALQKVARVRFTLSMTVFDLYRFGYAGQPMEWGDTVGAIIDPWGLETKARVIQLTKDLLLPENTISVIGDYKADIVAREVSNGKSANIGAQIAQNSPSLLQGYIDTAVLAIMSSKTTRRTMGDGSEMYETADGTAAVWFSGAGILLASTKDASGAWNWRTAITGAGIVADEITTGTLNAALVKILGTGTYLDGTSLVIQHPDISAKTVLDTSGLKLYDTSSGSDVFVGGLYRLGGTGGAKLFANSLQDPAVNSDMYMRLISYPGVGAGFGVVIGGDDRAEFYGNELGDAYVAAVGGDLYLSDKNGRIALSDIIAAINK